MRSSKRSADANVANVISHSMHGKHESIKCTQIFFFIFKQKCKVEFVAFFIIKIPKLHAQ